MRMMEIYVVALLPALVMLTDGATTRMSCNQHGCIGQPYNITCDISGTVAAGITWRSPGGEEVMTCPPTSGECRGVAGYKLVVDTGTRQVLQVEEFSPGAVGRWACHDGSTPPTSYCQCGELVSPELSGLTASCIQEEESFVVACTGLQNHGAPAVVLTLNGSTFAESTSVGSSLSMKDTKLNGEVFMCSVTGAATVCLDASTVTQIYTTCPGISCRSINTYLIVGEVILWISGLTNLIVLYLGSTGERVYTGQEEMVEKGTLWLLGIVLGVLMLLLGTIHAILVSQFCSVSTSVPIAGAAMCGFTLLIGLSLLVISVLKKVTSQNTEYQLPEDLKITRGDTSALEEDTDELEEDK
ncbi:uncharacterized protein LOC124128723 isoform X1 [Haliotis rufescens]|uniref:uncharacterized protein LOC124128723 isoform X1 n=1 Tax=Haliotis rufescens TaxID=6454 RepID=UPI00201E8727|nr:uncharacterized protein LOC124128723 isoform X1 [Haliotis rufescens]